MGNVDWERYSRGVTLSAIEKRHNDSLAWWEILKVRDTIKKCVDLQVGDELNWVGKGTQLSLANVMDTIRQQNPRDKFTKGIWAGGIPKTSMLIWKFIGKNYTYKGPVCDMKMKL